MATLEGKRIAIVGGSSGIGYAVAKASLLSLADHVIIGSSSQAKVEAAVSRLHAELSGKAVKGKISGDVIDARDSASVKAFFAKVGEIDHLVWSSGDSLQLGFSDVDLEERKDIFDVRFWGAAVAAQTVKISEGGSITLTIGQSLIKPRNGWPLIAGIVGAVDGLTRGLAVDLAPIRVNVVSPGLVDTEFWDPVAPNAKDQMIEAAAKSLLVKHVAGPDEIAEAYTFLMKCAYITGKRIEVDGGVLLV
ncbi:short-chain dehydrogenase/reductase SDR [Phellopilus nigrolimitatus]|nr:short-chain dehydrogenase/reductase SDR [Phellopilus nigrolimitatus]